VKKLLTLVLATFLLLISTFTFPAIAADTVNGEQIFSAQCAGCHINGGNIVRRGKNLKQQALKKYGMDSIEAVRSIVTNVDILLAVNGRGFFQSCPLELLVQRVHLLTTSCETITRDGSLLSLLVYFNTLFLYALQYSSNSITRFSMCLVF
jgi:cytochrome c6